MALIDKLQAIGDAIRAKTGETQKYTLDEMASKIQTISGGSASSKDEIDQYLDRSLERFDDINGEVSQIWNNGLSNFGSLYYVNIPNATKVGNYGLSNCMSLITVSAPKLTTIGTNAFYNDILLKDITLSNVTSIGQCAFENCTSLTAINIPKVTTIQYATFRGCSQLQTVLLDNVTRIRGNAFEDCKWLDTVILPKCTQIDNEVFKYIWELKTLVLGAPNVCTVSGDPFTGATQWLRIYVPRNLLTSYKAATNWSKYADHFFALEDRPVWDQ